MAVGEKRLPITGLVSGDNTLVAGVAGQVVTVLEYVLIPAAAVSVTWKSGSTALTGAMPIGGTAPASLSGSYNAIGHHVTAAGDGLVLNLSGSVAVTGFLIYMQQ